MIGGGAKQGSKARPTGGSLNVGWELWGKSWESSSLPRLHSNLLDPCFKIKDIVSITYLSFYGHLLAPEVFKNKISSRIIHGPRQDIHLTLMYNFQSHNQLQGHSIKHSQDPKDCSLQFMIVLSATLKPGRKALGIMLLFLVRDRTPRAEHPGKYG